MELCAFVYVDDSVCRGLSVPDGVVQEAFDPVEDDFEDREATAEPFPGQKIALPSNLSLFGRAELLNVRNDLQG